jgi:hypothetical protein
MSNAVLGVFWSEFLSRFIKIASNFEPLILKTIFR